MLPVIESLLRRAMDAKATADQREEELQLSQRIFFAGGMMVDLARTGRQRAEQQAAIQQTKDASKRSDAIGGSGERFLESGLLDFPCQLGEAIVLVLGSTEEEKGSRIGTRWRRVFKAGSLSTAAFSKSSRRIRKASLHGRRRPIVSCDESNIAFCDQPRSVRPENHRSSRERVSSMAPLA